MENKNIWSQSGDIFNLANTSKDLDKLNTGVYKIGITMQGEYYLIRVQDDYKFNYKIYGMETEFIKRVLITYNNTQDNLGVLLNGVKGTGKTVTAKIIANNLNLPIILVTKYTPGLIDFLNNIHQDVTILVDEYEKIFDPKEAGILTLMDGVLNNGYRKVFLLTTNDLYVNQNMLQRPGRVRYLKTFNDLTLPYITEIVEDKLEDFQFKEATIKFISKLKTITVDIISSIVEEVNIHNEDPAKFADIFNVVMNNPTYNVYKVNSKDEEKFELLSPHAWIGNSYGKNIEFELEDFDEYDPLYVNGRCLGNITEINDNIITVDNGVGKFTKYKFEANSPLHLSFMIS